MMTSAHLEDTLTDGMSGEQTSAGAALYDEQYYQHHCGPEPYTRSPKLLEMFGNLADNIIRTFAPADVIDVGCAHGFLVESLWDRGVRARGIDISPFAISQVRRDMVPHCTVGSVLEPIEGRYDLVCCIEVLEHIAEADVPAAIAHICALTDRVLFSSTPSDLSEPTHCYVQPPLVWIDHFAAAGFIVDLDADIAYVSPHAIAFKRSPDVQSSELRAFCSRLIRFRMLAHERGMLYFALAAAAQNGDAGQAAALRQAEEALARETGRLAEYAAANDALRHVHHELAVANRALTEELSYRRRKIDELTAEVDDLRAANVAYEVALNGAMHRVQSDVRRSLDAAHVLDQQINTVIASSFWKLKTFVSRLRK